LVKAPSVQHIPGKDGGKGLYSKNVRLKYEFVDVVRNTSVFENVTQNMETF